MNALHGKTILVGVSGGIAVYKVCALVSKLTQSGADVHVMMTRNATEFVAPLSFETLSHNRVVTDTFDRNFEWKVEHVSLAKKADLAVVAPATANIIAKLACGIADDFVTTTLLACKCPVMFAPAMNVAMLENQITRDNIKKLVSRGFTEISGVPGYLACGDTGAGRMAEPEVIFDKIAEYFSPKTDYVGKTVLVTAGATKFDIDPVRFITNRSSGKMGYAVASAAYRRGADIIFIKGSTDKFDIPSDWTVESVNTTREMADAVMRHGECDVAVMAAAPCDYETEASKQKIKSDTLSLELKKAPDIAALFGANKQDRKLVIFAAETNDCEANANKKLTAKKADMVVLNDVTAPGAGFDVDTDIATIISKKFKCELELMSKSELADIILDKILLL